MHTSTMPRGLGRFLPRPILANGPASIRSDIINAATHVELLQDIDAGRYTHPITIPDRRRLEHGATCAPIALDYWPTAPIFSRCVGGFTLNVPGVGSFSTCSTAPGVRLIALVRGKRALFASTWEPLGVFSARGRVGRYFIWTNEVT